MEYTGEDRPSKSGELYYVKVYKCYKCESEFDEEDLYEWRGYMSERPDKQPYSAGNPYYSGWNACIDAWEAWERSQPKDAVSVPTLWNIIYETLQKDRKSIKTLQLLSPEEIDAKLTHKIASSIARKLKGQDNEAK